LDFTLAMASLARLVETMETGCPVDPPIQSEEVPPRALAPNDPKTQYAQP
jgi:hypothetical protein